MNFTDYVVFINEKKEILIKLNSTIKKIELLLQLNVEWAGSAFKYTYLKKIHTNTTNYASNANEFTNITRAYFTKLSQGLLSINFLEFGTIINKFKENATISTHNIDKIYDNFIYSYNIIYNYIQIVDETKQAEKHNELIEALMKISNIFKEFLYVCEYLDNIRTELIKEDSEEQIELRLLNEDNSISNLVESMSLIEEIYNGVNKLIGREEKLRYGRIESGTLLTFLIGCTTALLTVKPLLEFGYKIYSEQFSRTAKLDQALKELKVRGEYIKIIKENGNIENINDFNISNKDEISKILANIEENIKQMYSKNPYISINGEKLGLIELKDKEINIKLLQSENEEDIRNLLNEDI